MNAVIKESSISHYIDNMSNDEYHNPLRGISASVVKSLIEDPALLKWTQDAPQNTDKMAAIDFGTDFHAYFLEPHAFKEKYKVLPEFNRRKKEEKEAEIALIEEWKDAGITAATHEDMAKLESMAASAMAHPTVDAIMSLDGVAERSYFWKDKVTGVPCKCRPDWLVLDINDNNRPSFMRPNSDILVADIKTIADISRIQAQIENLKYFVQEPFYTQGISQVEGGNVEFVFIFVSTSLSLGRYPVQVVRLTDTAVFDGKQLINEALNTYAQMSAGDESIWQTVVNMDRPHWATREEDILL
ncbi:PD-(D/E)XK nuclease-like domain-containing protein [uncultured Paraglaciecola sp.]|uniref:PD-(D/E)XK nuclease-like domain-containing protein n=1 Tax=uncultured Paraglaciecola sp. TaxID=1765024 RepID=UPI00260E17AC|nr:PD-(D/E)XK nuclease-like domain-containing protein [uncultured Paraglaciecola sp.]